MLGNCVLKNKLKLKTTERQNLKNKIYKGSVTNERN